MSLRNFIPNKAWDRTYKPPCTRPASFSRELGEEITDNLTKLNSVNYQQIGWNVEHLPQDVLAELSCDEKYIYIMSKRKYSDEKLSPLNPGTLHNARV